MLNHIFLAIENLYNTLNEKDPAEVEAELVARFLAKKPGWKESNFQVRKVTVLFIPSLLHCLLNFFDLFIIII